MWEARILWVQVQDQIRLLSRKSHLGCHASLTPSWQVMIASQYVQKILLGVQGLQRNHHSRSPPPTNRDPCIGTCKLHSRFLEHILGSGASLGEVDPGFWQSTGESRGRPALNLAHMPHPADREKRFAQLAPRLKGFRMTALMSHTKLQEKERAMPRSRVCPTTCLE